MDVVGVVTETGQAAIFNTTNNAQYAGTLSVNGTSFSGSFTGYAPFGDVFLSGQAVAPFTVSGMVNPGVSISGTYSGGGDQGTVSLTDDPSLYDQPSSLSLLTGTWEGTGADGATITITIQSNGSFNGQGTDGCSYLGSFSILNASFNVYGTSVGVACPGESYSVTGLALLGENTSTNQEEILYSISNATVSITGGMILQ